MVYCRNCGNILEDNARYCPKCGTPVQIPPQQPQSTQTYYPPTTHEDRTIIYLILAVIAAVIIIGVIIVALFAFGFLSGNPFPVGSGNVQTHEYLLSNFSAVTVSSGFNVQITQANTYSVKITADDNIFNYILANTTGDTLSIRLKPGMGIRTTTLRAEISMPDLQNVQLSGGVTGNAQSFNINHDVTVDTSGGSRITMTGQANNVTAIASGGSNINLESFTVYNANVDFSGGSQGTIDANGTLDATLSGGSHLYYKNNPTLGNINTSGGSGITKIS